MIRFSDEAADKLDETLQVRDGGEGQKLVLAARDEDFSVSRCGQWLRGPGNDE